MTQTSPFKISLGDFIEINMAIENDRELPEFSASRIYAIFNMLKPGDTIVVTPELPIAEHYGRNKNDADILF
jgi:hypothetical protein